MSSSSSSSSGGGSGGGGGGSKDNAPALTSSNVVLVLKNGARVTISMNCATQSELLCTTIDGAKTTESPDESGSEAEENCEEEDIEVNLSSLDLDQMEPIVAYMKYHTTTPTTVIPKPVPSKELATFVTDPFDLAFASPKEDEPITAFMTRMSHTLMAADYLVIPPLIQLLASVFAVRMKGASASQAFENFGLDPDKPFTEEDEAKVRQQYPWLETEM